MPSHVTTLLSWYFSRAPQHITVCHHSRLGLRLSTWSVLSSAYLWPTAFVQVHQGIRGGFNALKPLQVPEGCQELLVMGFNFICVWNWLKMWIGHLCLKILSSRKVRSSLLMWTWSSEQHFKVSFFILSHKTTLFPHILVNSTAISPKEGCRNRNSGRTQPSRH